jgi:hypothetical protein
MPHSRYQLLALARPETILSGKSRRANATFTLNLHSFFSNSTHCFLLVSADSDFAICGAKKSSSLARLAQVV